MVELQHSTESTGAASDARPSRPTAQEHRAEVQRLTDELQRVTTLASKLLDVSTALSEARSVEEVSRVFLTKGVAVVEASRAALVSAQGDRLDLLGTVGFTAQLERELHEMTL